MTRQSLSFLFAICITTCSLLPPLGSVVQASSPTQTQQHIKDLFHWKTKSKAKKALVKIGVKAVPALLKALHKSSWSMRNKVETVLKEIGSAAHPLLAKAILSPNENVRIVVTTLLKDQPELFQKHAGPAAIPGLWKVCVGKDWSARKAARKHLVHIGAAALPVLRKGLKAQGKLEVECALKTLQKMSPKVLQKLTETDLQTLAQMFRPEQLARNLGVLKVFLQMGPKALPVLPAILAQLAVKSSSIHMRVRAIIRKQGPAAIPTLRKALSDKSPRVRESVARTLDHFGSKAASAIPDLQKALGDKSPAVRVYAARAIGAIGTKQATSAVSPLAALLVQASLNKKSQWEAGIIAVALGRLTQHTPEAQKALHKSLAHPNHRVRCNALRGLGELKAKATTQLIQLVHKSLSDKLWSVNFAAVDALVKIGAKAVPSLIGLLSHKNPSLRHLAASALEKLGKHAKAALAKALKHTNPNTRRLAAKILGNLSLKRW